MEDYKILPLEHAYRLYITLIEEKDSNYEHIRFGINVNFDIHDYFRNHVKLNQKTGKFENTFGGKQNVKRKLVYEELEDRERLIKKEIERLSPEEEITREES